MYLGSKSSSRDVDILEFLELLNLFYPQYHSCLLPRLRRDKSSLDLLQFSFKSLHKLIYIL